MSLIYHTSIILFALKIFRFQHGLLLCSHSYKSHFGHSGDNVHESFWKKQFKELHLILACDEDHKKVFSDVPVIGCRCVCVC